MQDDPYASIATPVDDPYASIATDVSGGAPKTPAEAKRKLSLANLTSGYDPGAEEFDEKHPILGKPVRFLSAAGGAVLGMPGQVYHAFADPATEEEIKEHGPDEVKGLKRVGLGLERLTVSPVVSAAKDYMDPKTRPTVKGAISVLPEALGAGAGAVVGGELSGRVLSTVGKLRTAAADRFQPFARKFTGVEPAVKEAVGEAAEKHATATEEHENARTVDQQSTQLREKLGKVEESVAKEANSKFERVREKIGNPSEQPDNLVQSVKDVQKNVLQNIPENIKEFRFILGLEGMSGELADWWKGVLEDVAPGEQAEQAKPITWDNLQSLKSRLDARLRNIRGMNGDLVRGTFQVRDAVVDEMGKMAEANGAETEWKDARDFWRNYKQDFHEPSGPSGSGSPIAQALDAVDPKNVRQPFLNKQATTGNRALEILRKYPQHGGTEAASLAEKLIEGSQGKKLPTTAKPPTAPTVDVQKVAQEAIATRAKNWGNFNARDVGILSSSLIGGPILWILGERSLGGALVSASLFEGGKYAASRALNSPKIVEWLSRTPQAEVDVINKIPGADKVKIVNGLTEAAARAGKPVRLSPAARQLLGPANVARILAAGGAVTSNVKNRQDALTALGR